MHNYQTFLLNWMLAAKKNMYMENLRNVTAEKQFKQKTDSAETIN